MTVGSSSGGVSRWSRGLCPSSIAGLLSCARSFSLPERPSPATLFRRLGVLPDKGGSCLSLSARSVFPAWGHVAN